MKIKYLMKNEFEIDEVLEAVDLLLNNSKKKELKLEKEIDKPLKLTKELINKKDNIPQETENIISEAEKYLKKN